MVKCEYCGKSITKQSKYVHTNKSSCRFHAKGIYICVNCGFQTKLYHDFINHVQNCEEFKAIRIYNNHDLEQERIRSSIYKQILESILKCDIDSKLSIEHNHYYLDRILPNVVNISKETYDNPTEPVDLSSTENEYESSEEENDYEENDDTDVDTIVDMKEDTVVDMKEDTVVDMKEDTVVDMKEDTVVDMKEDVDTVDEKEFTFEQKIVKCIEQLKKGKTVNSQNEQLDYLLGTYLTSFIAENITKYNPHQIYQTIKQYNILGNPMNIIAGIDDSYGDIGISTMTKIFFNLIGYSEDPLDLNLLKNNMTNSYTKFGNTIGATKSVKELCDSYTPLYCLFDLELFVNEWICNRISPMYVYVPKEKDGSLEITRFYKLVNNDPITYKADVGLTELVEELSSSILESCEIVFRPLFKKVHKHNNLVNKLFTNPLLHQIGPIILKNAIYASCRFSLKQKLMELISNKSYVPAEAKFIKAALNSGQTELYDLQRTRANLGVPPDNVYYTEWCDKLFDGVESGDQNKMYLQFIQREFNNKLKTVVKYKQQVLREANEYK